MSIRVHLDNYVLVPDKVTQQPKYVSFNVLVEGDGGLGFLSCDWRLQDGILYGPWKRTGPRGFFTHTFVSETVARAIRQQAVADLLLMRETDPEIPVIDLELGWGPATYSPTNFKVMLPKYFEDNFAESVTPKVQGFRRSLKKQAKAVAIQAAKETLPRVKEERPLPQAILDAQLKGRLSRGGEDLQ
jgi:hypothetical protein